MSAILAIGAAYLIGAVPIGYLVGRAFGVADIRRHGSGTIGATNVLRAVGRLKRDAPWARRLIAAGRGADVDACLRLDTTKLVPRYVPNVDKIVGDHR